MYGSQTYSLKAWRALNPGLAGLGATLPHNYAGGTPVAVDPIKESPEAKAQREARAAEECRIYQETGKLPGRLTAPPPLNTTPEMADAHRAQQARELEKFTAACGGSSKLPLILGGLALIGVTLGVLYTKRAAFGLATKAAFGL